MSEGASVRAWFNDARGVSRAREFDLEVVGTSDCMCSTLLRRPSISFADLLGFLQVRNEYFFYNTQLMLVYDEQLTATELMLSHRESQTGGIESMAFRHHTERKSFINQLS